MNNLKSSHQTEVTNLKTMHADQLRSETDALRKDKEETVSSLKSSYEATIA